MVEQSGELPSELLMLSLELIEQLPHALIHKICHRSFLSCQFFLHAQEQGLAFGLRHLETDAGYFVPSRSSLHLGLGPIGRSIEEPQVVFGKAVSLSLKFEPQFGMGARTEERFGVLWPGGVVGFVLAQQSVEVEPLAHDLSWIIIQLEHSGIVWLVSAGVVDQDHRGRPLRKVLQTLMLLQTPQCAVDFAASLIGTFKGSLDVVGQSAPAFGCAIVVGLFVPVSGLFQIVLDGKGSTSSRAIRALSSACFSCSSSLRIVSVYESAQHSRYLLKASKEG